MHDGLDNVRRALAAMTEADLDALQVAAETGPQLSPGLLVFLAHACDWELARRAGRHFALNGPHAAIGPEEIDVALAVLVAVHAAVDDNIRVVALLAATGEVLEDDPPALQ